MFWFILLSCIIKLFVLLLISKCKHLHISLMSQEFYYVMLSFSFSSRKIFPLLSRFLLWLINHSVMSFLFTMSLYPYWRFVCCFKFYCFIMVRLALQTYFNLSEFIRILQEVSFQELYMCFWVDIYSFCLDRVICRYLLSSVVS